MAILSFSPLLPARKTRKARETRETRETLEVRETRGTREAREICKTREFREPEVRVIKQKIVQLIGLKPSSVTYFNHFKTLKIFKSRMKAEWLGTRQRIWT